MQTAPNPILSFLPIAAIFLIFYVLVIRPQQKQQKAHENMLAGLKKGDKILTTGGLYGTIVGTKGADGSDLEVRFSETVKLTVARSAVARLLVEGQAVEAGSRNGNTVA